MIIKSIWFFCFVIFLGIPVAGWAESGIGNVGWQPEKRSQYPYYYHQ